MVLADALLWLYQKGYIKAFAPVQRDPVDAVMYQLGRPICTGGNLTDDAQQDFQATPKIPWSVANGQTPDPQDGHCFGRLKSESPTGLKTLLTWGDEQPAETDWCNACESEHWVYFTQEDLDEMDPTKRASLIAAIDALPSAHGIAAPGPDAPPDVTPPAPAPTGLDKIKAILHQACRRHPRSDQGVVMTRQATEVQAITLPTWSDPTSVTSYALSLAFMVIPFIALVHPGFNPPAADIQAGAAIVGTLVAGGVQLVNYIRHIVVTKAGMVALAAGARLAVVGRARQVIVAPAAAPLPSTTAAQVVPAAIFAS